MCGIAGFVSKRGDLPHHESLSTLREMCDRIAHRGPDGDGQQVLGRAGLGHRRLAVIDLDNRSAQPMLTEDGRYAVVFNGEIYNFPSLRAELQATGAVFRTASDTEVLLHGYRRWGDALPEHLRGMFAFAIWDRIEERLFMARDRFGQKPLYLCETADTFVFGSEIKSLLAHPALARSINYSAVHDFMTYGYCAGPETAFAGVERIAPAQALRIERGGSRRCWAYWQAPAVATTSPLDRDSAAEALLERFEDAVQARMVADVPLGAFLSGGVDSSAIVAQMTAMSDQPVKTFSVGFDVGVEGYDETDYARRIAQQFRSDHHSFLMGHEIVEALGEVVWHYGEPYADSSCLVMYALAREVRKHVTVAMTGDGADELLLGYSRYGRFRDSVAAIREQGMEAAIPYRIGPYQDLPLLRDVYGRFISKYRDEHKMRGYGPALLEYLFTPSTDLMPLALETARADTAIDLAGRADVLRYLPDDILVKSDIATMAHGLEARSPFLDHELAALAMSLPQGLRVFERCGSEQMKALLKYALEPTLPAEILYRKKSGFSVPVKHWMKNQLKDFMVETLSSRRFEERGFIEGEYVAEMLRSHLTDREDHGTRLWNLLVLELWCQTFIDANGAGPVNLSFTSDTRSTREVSVEQHKQASFV